MNKRESDCFCGPTPRKRETVKEVRDISALQVNQVGQSPPRGDPAKLVRKTEVTRCE